MATTDLSNSYFDTEPERMAPLMRTWWFSAVVGGSVLLILGVGSVLWFTAPVTVGAVDDTGPSPRPEQKLLNKKQLQDVLDAYTVRAQKAEGALATPPLADPSK